MTWEQQWERKRRESRKIVESTLHHDDWSSSEDGLATAGTTAHTDHEDVIDAGVAA
jgi:hypothetical protein